MTASNPWPFSDTKYVAAALSIVQGGSPEENLKGIVAGHPHDVSPHLWEAVCRACGEIGGNS